MKSSLAELRRKPRHPYFVDGTHPFHDFNKEVVPPGWYPAHPRGAVAIRCDDDFYAVAALPLRYRTVPTRVLVRKLWPRKWRRGISFGPDTKLLRLDWWTNQRGMVPRLRTPPFQR